MNEIVPPFRYKFANAGFEKLTLMDTSKIEGRSLGYLLKQAEGAALRERIKKVENMHSSLWINKKS